MAKRTRLAGLGLLAGAACLAGGVMAQDKAPPQKDAAPPPRAAAPAAPTPPANELAEIARLRAMLGPELRLRYAAARQEGARTFLSGVEVEGAPGSLRAEEAVLEGVRDDGFDRVALRGLAAGEARAEAAELRGFSMLAGPRRPEAFALDRMEATGLRVEADWPFGAARLVAEGYGRGREFSLLAEDLAVSAEPAAGGPVERVALRRLSFRSSDLSALLGAVVDSLAGTAPLPPPTVEGWQRLEAEDLAVTAPGGARLGGVARVEFRSDAPAGRAATSAFRATDIALAAGGPLAAFLEPLGYRDLHADFVLDSSQDEASGRFEIGAAAFAVRGVAALGLSLALDGVRQGQILQGMDQVAFVSARLRYADDSLLGRALEAQARERRVPLQTVRREWEREVARALADPPRQRNALAPIREPVLRLVRGQARELEVAANPPRPLGAGALDKLPNDAAGWQRLLGLTVTAR